MARPQKEGVDYFPLDVHTDIKLELIEAEFGLTGFGVIVKLWQKIYATQGYYIEWTNEVALLFAKSVGLGGNVVSEILAASIRRGIFDKDLYEKYRVLTSKGIQKRYFEMVQRRTEINVKKEYLLVNVTQNQVNVDNNSVNVDNNSVNVCNNSQSKVKESKVNKSKLNKSKRTYGAYSHVWLTDDELKKLRADYENADSLITYLDEYIEMKGYKAKSHYLAIKKWVVDAVTEQNRRKNKPDVAKPTQDGYQSIHNVDYAEMERRALEKRVRNG